MEKGKCRIKNVDSQLRYCPRPLEGRGHVTLARGDSNTLRLRRAPLHSGFSRKSREKRQKAAKNASSFEPVCTVTQLPRGSIRPVHYVVHFFYRMC